MIVDLNLQDKKIVIIGGGNEAQKRINSTLKQGGSITVISDSVNTQIDKLVKSKKIKFIKQRITNAQFITKLKPDLIITTTNDQKINQKS